MTELFLSFVNRSITAGWMILPVLCLRWCLRNFRSKDLICILWGLSGCALPCPSPCPVRSVWFHPLRPSPPISCIPPPIQ